jgi:polyisoprenoid-binding protein YceI
MRKIIGALLALVVLAVGGFFVWFFLIKPDAPDRLGAGDLDAALGNTTTIAVDTTAAPGTGAPTSTSSASPTSVVGGDITDVTGSWAVASADSTVGYRAKEVLGGLETEGAGRTDQVTGTMTVDGTTVTAAEFSADMASVTSDSDRRDNQFRTRIMSVDQFPTASFRLTSPIDVGSVPAAGAEVTVDATGELTLRGVTNTVTFPITAKIDNGRIGVLGSIPVKWSDYQIPDPSNAFAKVQDNGLMEFVIVFDRGS